MSGARLAFDFTIPTETITAYFEGQAKVAAARRSAKGLQREVPATVTPPTVANSGYDWSKLLEMVMPFVTPLINQYVMAKLMEQEPKPTVEKLQTKRGEIGATFAEDDLDILCKNIDEACAKSSKHGGADYAVTTDGTVTAVAALDSACEAMVKNVMELSPEECAKVAELMAPEEEEEEKSAREGAELACEALVEGLKEMDPEARTALSKLVPSVETTRETTSDAREDCIKAMEELMEMCGVEDKGEELKNHVGNAMKELPSLLEQMGVSSSATDPLASFMNGFMSVLDKQKAE